MENLSPSGGGAILSPNLGRVCPVSGIVYSAPREALNFTLNMSNRQPRLANKKWGHFGDPAVAMIFLKIWGNRGQPITSCGAPIWNPNRARLCPILGIASSPPPEGLNFALNMGNPQPRLANKNGAILETRRLPRIFLKIRGNHGQPITVWGGPILNPNRGRVCPISGIVYSPPPEALNLLMT